MKWFWRTYTAIFVILMIVVLLFGLWVASSITDEFQARRVEKCFEQSDYCKQWMNDWIPVARWEDA